jgi:hypothetical protein
MGVVTEERGEASAGLRVDRDSEADSATGVVVPDLELEGVEQQALEVLGQRGQVQVDDGQLIEEAQIVGGRYRQAGDCGELALGAFALGGEVGEGGAQLGSPLLVDVVVAGAAIGLLVDDRDWTPDAYERWLTEQLCRAFATRPRGRTSLRWNTGCRCCRAHDLNPRRSAAPRRNKPDTDGTLRDALSRHDRDATSITIRVTESGAVSAA